jgi:segregation and condensation protein B
MYRPGSAYHHHRGPGRLGSAATSRPGQPTGWQTGRGQLGPGLPGLNRWHPAFLAAPTAAPSQLTSEVTPTPAPSAADQPRLRVEAVLFAAREPIGYRKLAQLAGLADATQARTMVTTLNRLYECSGRAFRIEEMAGGVQMLTCPELAAWVRKLPHVPPPMRLSTPQLETLAVVAYRQPVLRADIEAIRGVSCGELLRQLMQQDLVGLAGRSESLGRPFLYGTTPRFLRVMGLASIDQLPRLEWVRAAQFIGAQVRGE